MSGPCEWPVSYVACHNTEALVNMPPEEKLAVEAMAAQFLWNWTNSIYGPCPVEYRPCRQNCHEGPGRAYQNWGGSPWTPYLYNGQWYNVSCGTCHKDMCGCEYIPSINLGWPVAEVTQVLIDGAVLAPAAYRLDGSRLLVRVDGEAWPACQNMAAEPNEVDTWQVTFLRGLEVPVGGQIAAGVLAAEMAKALCNDGTCQLPQRVQTITRQGISVTMVDDFQGLNEAGRTGLWLVDSWVSSVTRPPRGGSVRSPDYRQRGFGSPVSPAPAATVPNL